jgi:hypothetical protein
MIMMETAPVTDALPKIKMAMGANHAPFALKRRSVSLV